MDSIGPPLKKPSRAENGPLNPVITFIKLDDLSMIKKYLVWSLLAISVGTLSACQAELKCHVDPVFFCSNFNNMSQDIAPDLLEDIKSTPRDSLGKLHPSFGMYVRNSFDLWSENEVTSFFRKNGISHPDAMSYVIVAGFADYLNGRTVDMIFLSKELTAPPPSPPSQ